MAVGQSSVVVVVVVVGGDCSGGDNCDDGGGGSGDGSGWSVVVVVLMVVVVMVGISQLSGADYSIRESPLFLNLATPQAGQAVACYTGNGTHAGETSEN